MTVLAAGVEHVGEPEGRSHLPDNVANSGRAKRGNWRRWESNPINANF
jgi:hypothetical protein